MRSQQSRFDRLAAALLVACCSAALAQQPLTLDEAVNKVRQETDARVLVAERTDEGGRVRFRIKLLTEDGTVKVIFVDPETGRIEN